MNRTSSAPLRTIASWALDPRVFMAMRAAVAAVVAWAIALALPDPVNDYPYYAPLGAVIANSFTVAGSMRQTVQSGASILIGAVVAVSASALVGVEFVSIAFVVGAGVLLAGWKFLGDMGSWVATSGLLVLIFGRGDPTQYVIAYAGLTLMGAAIGAAVNVLLPPAPVGSATSLLAHLRETLAAQIIDLADGLEQDRRPTAEQWNARRRETTPLLVQLRSTMEAVHEGSRGNARSALNRDLIERHQRHARAMERLAFLVEDLNSSIGENETFEQEVVALGPSLRPRTAEVLRLLAEAIRAPHEDDGRAPEVVASEANDALADLARTLRQLDEAEEAGVDLFSASAIVDSLRRCMQILAEPESEPH